MIREIKFRAKGDDKQTKDKWFYGSYYQTDDTTYCFEEDYANHPDNTKHYILFDEMTDWGLPNRKMRASINPETLGQFTGLCDKNENRIYEGDILKGTFYGYLLERDNEIFAVKWDEKNAGFLANYFEPSKCEVIGNVFENPELLKGK